MLFRLTPVFLASTMLAFAAPAPSPDSVPFSARELAQGFREHTILARPHAHLRATADAAETREGVHVREKFPRLGELRVIELDDTDSVDAAIARLQATGRYEFVERDLIRHADVTPSDTSFTTQWDMNNTGQSGGVVGADIKALAAWDIIHDAPGVIVAVVDTGVNLSHQDIAANLWINPSPSSRNDINGANFVGGRGSIVSGNPTDDNGHGTHVAGTIGAVGNNNLAVTGVAWRVQIMALKALSASGSGSVSDLAAAVNYALQHGANIINASYGESGGSGFSQTEYAALVAAHDAGVIFVAAAGNDTADMDISPHYPASHALDNIVSVGSSGRSDFASSFSNYGPAVDLFAPGDQILSLLYSNNTGTQTLSGTSMATPHVAGALALLKAQFPNDTYRQLINRLLRGLDYSVKFSGKSGVPLTGRLNLLNALTTTTNRPFNDDFASRSVITGYSNIVVRSNNAGATTESGEPAPANANATGSLWFEWTAPATGTVSLDTSGSNYDTVLGVYTGTALNALAAVAANDDDGALTTSRLKFNAQSGVTYEIVVAGKNGASGLTMLNLGTTPDNDTFANATTLSGASTHVTGSNSHCSLETGEPRILGFAGGTSLWYRWTAPKNGQFQAAAISNDFAPLLAVYTGTALTTLSAVSQSGGTTAGNGTAQTGCLCTFNASAGTTYFLKVDSKSATAVGQFTLSLTDSLWQSVTGAAVTGSPAVAPDGTIYVGSTDNSLYAFNPDGTTKWSFATGSIIDTCSPAIAADGTVYVGSFDGKFYAVNPDGTQKWTHSFGTTITVANSPTIAADGTIYVKPSDGLLYALNPTDGTTKWSRNVGGISSYASAAIAPDGTVYQGSENKNFYALNPADGSIKWSVTADNDIYTVPAIDAAGNVYFGVLNSAKFYSFTSAGTLRWVYSGATLSTTSSPCLSADGGTVYFAAYDGKLHAVKTADGTVRWTYLLNATNPSGIEVRASSPAVDANGVIYIGCYDFKLYAVNPDGTLKRTWDTGNWIRSCPAIFGTTLYTGSNDGKLYALDVGAPVASGPWSQYRANARRLGRAVAETFAITVQPNSQTAVAGLPLTLSVTATGSGVLSYQWKKDGTAISGATSASYSVSSTTATDAGSYTVTITSTQGTLTSNAAVITVEPANPGRLINLSVRTTAGTGAQTLTVGFVMSDGTAKPILIRGIGPSLTQFGVTGALADPQMQLFASALQSIASNNDWSSDPTSASTIATAAASVGAFPLATGSKDAALLWTLSSGSASVQVTGVGSTTGIALAELYDTAPGTGARLINVSARAQVGTGSGILIAGFVINGNVPKRVLIRGIGPGLTQFGVTGVLADPQLSLYRDSTLLQSNDDWGGQTSSTFTQVGAFPLTNTASKDSVLLVTLAPGTYTAQVSGVGSTTGVALIEIYEAP